MNPKRNITILAVDDEEFNLDILTDYLTDSGYEVIGARDGIEALEALEQYPEIAVVVLDRMMPRLDGMELATRMKANPEWHDIPVIMQTAAATSEEVMQGIRAGVFYYLTKPYNESLLLSIVASACEDAENRKQLRSEVTKHVCIPHLMQEATFTFRTLEDAKNLAYFIANGFPDPGTAVYGVTELLVNAVEHGNLGITYAEKTALLESGRWQAEVTERLNNPLYRDRHASLTFKKIPGAVEVCIIDQGDGFVWNEYLELTPERATDPHGRGIATARMLSFDSVTYAGNGNTVTCVKKYESN